MGVPPVPNNQDPSRLGGGPSQDMKFLFIQFVDFLSVREETFLFKSPSSTPAALVALPPDASFFQMNPQTPPRLLHSHGS